MSENDQAIRRLIYRYAECLDLGDFDSVADLLAHATVRSDRRPEVRRGRDQIVALYRDSVTLYDGIPCTKHVTTNVIVDAPEGAVQASAHSYYSVLQARPDLPLQVIIGGRYHDQFECVAGQWRFSDRLIFVDLVGDLRFHLKRAVPRR